MVLPWFPFKKSGWLSATFLLENKSELTVFACVVEEAGLLVLALRKELKEDDNRGCDCC